MGEEKIAQIYDILADLTLNTLKEIKDSREDNSFEVLDAQTLVMVRTTQALYETLNHANPMITTASALDVSGN